MALGPSSIVCPLYTFSTRGQLSRGVPLGTARGLAFFKSLTSAADGTASFLRQGKTQESSGYLVSTCPIDEIEGNYVTVDYHSTPHSRPCMQLAALPRPFNLAVGSAYMQYIFRFPQRLVLRGRFLCQCIRS